MMGHGFRRSTAVDQRPAPRARRSTVCSRARARTGCSRGAGRPTSLWSCGIAAGRSRRGRSMTRMPWPGGSSAASSCGCPDASSGSATGSVLEVGGHRPRWSLTGRRTRSGGFLPSAYRDLDELDGFLEHLAGEVHDPSYGAFSRGCSVTGSCGRRGGERRARGAGTMRTSGVCSSTRWRWRRSRTRSASCIRG